MCLCLVSNYLHLLNAMQKLQVKLFNVTFLCVCVCVLEDFIYLAFVRIESLESKILVQCIVCIKSTQFDSISITYAFTVSCTKYNFPNSFKNVSYTYAHLQQRRHLWANVQSNNSSISLIMAGDERAASNSRSPHWIKFKWMPLSISSQTRNILPNHQTDGDDDNETKRQKQRAMLSMLRWKRHENENNRNRQHHRINNTRGRKKRARARLKWKLCIR